MKKKRMLTAVALAMVASLAACGGENCEVGAVYDVAFFDVSGDCKASFNDAIEGQTTTTTPTTCDDETATESGTVGGCNTITTATWTYTADGGLIGAGVVEFDACPDACILEFKIGGAAR